MPLNNRSNNRSSNSRFGKKPAATKLRGGKDFNMLTFGVGFLDDDGKNVKVRILLKKEDSGKGIIDESGEQYSREEAAQLLAAALLEGRGISLYLFENDDGSMSGNARIDIKGLTAEEEAPAPQAASRRTKPQAQVPAKRTYPTIADDDDADDLEIEEVDEDDLPY